MGIKWELVEKAMALQRKWSIQPFWSDSHRTWANLPETAIPSPSVARLVFKNRNIMIIEKMIVRSLTDLRETAAEEVSLC
jgi:hypothetical protein